nr:MAG: integrase family protein [Bacteriophage sp.]
MGRYRSIQSTLIEAALKGITDNQTVTAYKKDCKLFAAYCKEQGVKRPDQLQWKEKELLQGYEKELEASGYSPATIHRRLAAPCKATGISMSEIEKPKRTSGKITRSRNEKANRQGKREIEDERYSRLVTFQRAVGIRRAELARLTAIDLTTDESGYLCVYVAKGKGGKRQLQRILPEDEITVLEIFQVADPGQKLFSPEEMQNKIDLHGLRREHAQKAYKYYADRLKNEPEYKYELRKELAARYKEFHRPGDSNKKFLHDIMNEEPYKLRGNNYQKAIEQGKETEYNRLALMAVSVFHLSHWRLDVTVTNYMI